MHLRIFTQLFLVAVFSLSTFSIISCKKDDNIAPPPEKDVKGLLSNVGLLDNFDLFDPADNAIHIDPTNVNDPNEDGSLKHPFNSYDDINWKDGTTYALKRGTTYKGPGFAIFANNATLCSYGNGNRPAFICTDTTTISGNRHAIISDWNGIKNLTIRDLEISAPHANSCIRILSNCDSVNIINCKIHDSYWGIRSIGNRNLKIENTEVYNTYDDGMFIENNEYIEISNCYVHHVNLNWAPPSTPESDAAGDGIQFNACNHWHVHHNKIDRSNSGNKFCFISNNANQNDGILEHNILTGPTFDGLSTYFHNGNGIIIRYNIMSDCAGGPVYTHSTNFLIHHNIFKNNGGALFASKSAFVYNNLFYNNTQCLQGGNIEASNNIFDTKTRNELFKVKTLSGSNNLFVNATPTENSFTGKPAYLDEEAGDFHLVEGSACIDKGIYLGISRDFDGVSIQQGQAPDIGPFEFYE